MPEQNVGPYGVHRGSLLGGTGPAAETPSRLCTRTHIALAALGILTAILYRYTAPLPPLLTDDSAGYIDWSPIRSPGYPAFLELVGWLNPDLSAVFWFQSPLLVLATSFMAAATGRLAERRWIAVALALSVFLLIPLWNWSGQVRPEVLFIALVQVFLGATACLLATSRVGWAWLAGVALGATVLVRPVGMAFLPSLLLVAIFSGRRDGLRRAISLLAPPVALFAVCIAINGTQRGYYSAQAFTGLTLLGKTTSLIPQEGLGDPISAELGSTFVPLHDAVKDASGPILYWVARQGYDVALWDVFVPLSRRLSLTIVAADSAAMAVARKAIRHDPVGYARLVFTNWLAMWTWPWLTTASVASSSLQVIEQPALHALLGRKAKLSDSSIISPAFYWMKLAVATTAFFVCLAPAVLVLIDRGRDPLLIFAAASGLALHVYNLLVGAVQFADNRYAQVVLPVLCVSLLLSTWCLARWFRGPAGKD